MNLDYIITLPGDPNAWIAPLGERFDMQIARAYVYFSIVFAGMIEVLNIRMRKKQTELFAAANE